MISSVIDEKFKEDEDVEIERVHKMRSIFALNCEFNFYAFYRIIHTVVWAHVQLHAQRWELSLFLGLQQVPYLGRATRRTRDWFKIRSLYNNLFLTVMYMKIYSLLNHPFPTFAKNQRYLKVCRMREQLVWLRHLVGLTHGRLWK